MVDEVLDMVTTFDHVRESWNLARRNSIPGALHKVRTLVEVRGVA